jgi:microtubule-associated protein-like 1/2
VSDAVITVVSFSPDGNFLAVGSYDNNIYIYKTHNYSLQGTCKKHTSFIVSLDWSMNCQYIRSVCFGNELHYFKMDTFAHDINGPTNTLDLVWYSQTAKFGWLVEGIFPAGVDATFINTIEFNKEEDLVATGDDNGVV